MKVVENIGTLLTFVDASNETGACVDDPIVVIDGETIAYAGARADAPVHQAHEHIDAAGAVVMPGLVDCHSHLIFWGMRADEFARRMRNESYQTIMAKGGGIMSTVAKTRAASDAELYDTARQRADQILRQGVTTLEVKSGYGLSCDDELRILRVAERLSREHALDIHPSFLGAHAVPAEFKNKREDYVSLIIDEMLPAIAKEKLAVDCDVFCEESAFTVAEARAMFTRAQALGFGLRAHVQQLAHSGGVTLVKEFPIKSISHADFLSDDDIALLSHTSVIVEALPFAALFLRSKAITPVSSLQKAGVQLAIATDFNPGSAMCHDLILAARLGVTYLGFGTEDALRAITFNAARALGRSDVGVIKAGAQADVVITNCISACEILYDWTKHPVKTVIKRGEIVSRLGG